MLIDASDHPLGATGEELSHRDLMATCMLLFVAGFETTVNVLGNGVLALLRHPNQLERFHILAGPIRRRPSQSSAACAPALLQQPAPSTV
jgi:hypothetical protein